MGEAERRAVTAAGGDPHSRGRRVFDINHECQGYAEFSLPAQLTLWSPSNPKLYDVTIAAETDTVSDQIGFRTIEVKGTDILLNGKSLFLRGVSIHEEAPYRARPRLLSGRRPHTARLGQGDGLQLRAPGTLSSQREHDP